MQIALLMLLFFAGVLARHRGWLTPRHGAFMLNVVATVGLPALFIANISGLALSRDMLWLPAIAAVLMLAMCGVALLAGRTLALPRPALGAYVITAMAINLGFLYPFVLAGWGEGAFAQLALLDFGNAAMQCTLMYALAARFGGHSAGVLALLRRAASFPPLWALLIAVTIKLGGVVLPAALLNVLQVSGRLIVLLVIVALGVLFAPRHLRSPTVLSLVALRIVGGLALGFVLVSLLGLEGETRAVVLLGAAAPVGYNAVVMASRESLDQELAASAASLSVLLGVLYVPLALLWLQPG